MKITTGITTVGDSLQPYALKLLVVRRKDETVRKEIIIFIMSDFYISFKSGQADSP